MTPEDRLRQAIDARTGAVVPSPDGLTRIEEKLMEAQENQNRKRWLVGGGIAAAVALLILGIVVLTGDDDQGVDTVGTTTTTEATTTSSTTSTTVATTEATFDPTVDPAVPLFPDAGSSARFDDPVAVALAFAKDMVGYTDPQAGPFQAGDARSGEVEIRPRDGGIVSEVSVRQLEDDTWFVVGAATESIRLTSPQTGAKVTSPIALSGKAFAFEGVVNVRLFADGTQTPIGETTVMGRGDGVLGGFTGSLTYSEPGSDYGVLILSEASAMDGGAAAMTAIRVAF